VDSHCIQRTRHTAILCPPSRRRPRPASPPAPDTHFHLFLPHPLFRVLHLHHPHRQYLLYFRGPRLGQLLPPHLLRRRLPPHLCLFIRKLNPTSSGAPGGGAGAVSNGLISHPCLQLSHFQHPFGEFAGIVRRDKGVIVHKHLQAIHARVYMS